MAEADVSLRKAVVTALAVAVKKQDDGPFLTLAPVGGEEDLEAIGFAIDGDRAIEKSSFGFAGGCGGRESGEEQEE